MSNVTITAILADTLAHGFEFITEVVKRKSGNVEIEYTGAQIPVVRDLDKFVAAFGPALVLAALDGSSLRVSAQRINRDALVADRKTPADKLREAVATWMLGAKRTGSRTRIVEVEVFLDIEGGKHATKEEAKAASMAILAAE